MLFFTTGMSCNVPTTSMRIFVCRIIFVCSIAKRPAKPFAGPCALKSRNILFRRSWFQTTTMFGILWSFDDADEAEHCLVL